MCFRSSPKLRRASAKWETSIQCARHRHAHPAGAEGMEQPSACQTCTVHYGLFPVPRATFLPRSVLIANVTKFALECFEAVVGFSNHGKESSAHKFPLRLFPSTMPDTPIQQCYFRSIAFSSCYYFQAAQAWWVICSDVSNDRRFPQGNGSELGNNGAMDLRAK